MSDYLRWGVLGASKFALNHMAPAINAAPRGVLAALATSSRDKARPFEAMAPGLQVHLDYDALLEDDQIDAVYVPLPNHLHLEWSLKAIAAGKHVLCEKPMTLRAQEFDQLIAARDASGLVVAEAYMIVFHPQWIRARQMVQDGAIGTLQHVEGFFCYDNPDAGNIRNRPETGGGGIRDIGVYTMGATRFVTGQEPLEFTNTDIQLDNGIDATADISAKFDGFTARWVTSMRLHPWQEMRFHGTKGILRLTAPFNPNQYDIAELELHQDGLGRRIERFPDANHYITQVATFNAAALGEGGFRENLEFARGTQVMIDRIFQKSGLA